MRITPYGIRTTAKKKEANKWPTKSMQSTSQFFMRMKLCGYCQMAEQLRPTSVWLPMTSHYYHTGQSLTQWSTIIFPSPSTPNCPRLMALGEPTTISRKRTGHGMLMPTINTFQKQAKQELSNNPRRPSGKQ